MTAQFDTTASTMVPGDLGMWGGHIRREALLQKISLLAMLGGVREGPREHPLTSTPGQERTLTVEQEAEIAGNLAFLSRRRKDSLSVAAIGIEEDEDGQGMVVRLCINGGILSRIEDGVKEMCAMLEQISRQRMALCSAVFDWANPPRRVGRR